MLKFTLRNAEARSAAEAHPHPQKRTKEKAMLKLTHTLRNAQRKKRC